MATKWRNRIALGVMIVLLTFGIQGVLNTLQTGKTYMYANYFETPDFRWQLHEFVQLLGTHKLYGMTESEMVDRLHVTEQEIESFRLSNNPLLHQLEQIAFEYDERIQEAQSHSPHEVVQLELEREKAMEEANRLFQDDEFAKAQILAEKEKQIENYYANVKAGKQELLRLESVFTYFIKDTTTGEVFTNVNSPAAEGIPPSEYRFYQQSISSSDVAAAGQVYDEFGYLFFEQEPKMLEGEIVVLPRDDNYLVQNYHNYQERQVLYFITVVLSIISILLFIYMYRKTKKVREAMMDKWRPSYRSLPFDIRIGLILITVICAIQIIVDNSYSYPYGSIGQELMRLSGFMLVAPFLGFTLVQGAYIKEYERSVYAFRKDIKSSLLYRWYARGLNGLLKLPLPTQLLILLVILFLFGILIGASIVQHNIFFLVVFLLVGLPISVAALRQTNFMTKIMKNVRKLRDGEVPQDLPVREDTLFGEYARNVNELKQIVKASQSEQAKSERLKAELITNVSHDLRTPLTSIITYTELLKGSELSQEERATYLQIIDRKSKRLKSLIDDLFEVSKMTSGNVELHKERVDVCQLLQQALAEHDETIQQSTLTFKVKTPEPPLLITVDGQKLWRVFDNIIGNILKYSLEHSRVYITVEDRGSTIALTFKNVSKYELGGNTEEMLERFKRGDTSRNTEGSGLGLAIAKSIIDLHNGSLDIEADGDLFKVNATLQKDILP